jgi:hypothetical protein
MPPFRYIWRHWTIQPRRFGWQSWEEFAQSDSELQSNFNPQYDHLITSKLCRDCSRVVRQSGLLTGSRWFFTRRIEWHDWHMLHEDMELDLSGKSCHLCNIFRLSIPEIERVGHSNGGDQNHQTLKMRIWEDYRGRWYDEPLRYMQVCKSENEPFNGIQIRRGNTSHRW